MEKNYNSTEQEKENYGIVSLLSLLRVLLRNVFIILLVMIVFANVGLYYAANRISPTFNTGFIAYINNTSSKLPIESLSSMDTDASASLALTYARIIQSRDVVEAALRRSGLPYEYDQIRGAISSEAEEDTQLINMSVTMYSPKEAYDLAVALARETPPYLESIVEGSSMKIVQKPVFPVDRSGPNARLYIMLGAGGGFVLSVFVIAVLFLLNDKIKSPGDLERGFPYAVLGDIPYISR